MKFWQRCDETGLRNVTWVTFIKNEEIVATIGSEFLKQLLCK